MFTFEAVLNGKPFPIQARTEPSTLMQAGAIALYYFERHADLRLDSKIQIKTNDPWPAAGTVTSRAVLVWATSDEAKEFFKQDGTGVDASIARLRIELPKRI